MNFLVTFIAVIAIARGQKFDPGRQMVNNAFDVPMQPGQQRYVMREIILYLTPTQIRALQETQGLINPPQDAPTNTDKHTQALMYHQNEQFQSYQQPNQYLQQKTNIAPLPNPTPTAQESQSNPFVPIIPPPEYRQPEAVAHNSFQTKNQKRILKPVPFFPYSNKEEPKNEPKAIPVPRPQESLPESDDDDQMTRQLLKEQWLRLLNQNIAYFKALDVLSQHQRESNQSKINFHYLSQNNQKYDDNKHAGDVYSLVRANKEHQLEKQQAMLQAGAIANSPPVVVQKEIRHTPAQFISHVPTPVLVSIPDAVKINIPRPYVVPLEMLRTIPLPILRTQTNEIDRPVPTEHEKQIPLPTTRDVYGDRPYFVQRAVPEENQMPNQDNTLMHSHVWHH